MRASLALLAALCLSACSKGSCWPLDERLTWQDTVLVSQDHGDGAKPVMQRGDAAITNLPRRARSDLRSGELTFELKSFTRV